MSSSEKQVEVGCTKDHSKGRPRSYSSSRGKCRDEVCVSQPFTFLARLDNHTIGPGYNRLPLLPAPTLSVYRISSKKQCVVWWQRCQYDRLLGAKSRLREIVSELISTLGSSRIISQSSRRETGSSSRVIHLPICVNACGAVPFTRSPHLCRCCRSAQQSLSCVRL